MDGATNVLKQQTQVQTNVQATQARVSTPVKTTQQAQVQTTDVVKQMQQEAASGVEKITSKEQVQEIVDQLNEALSPISTSIKFGVDSQNVFYVSVIESETSKMIRRFPVEQARDFLPKMQELTGVLFDSKG